MRRTKDKFNETKYHCRNLFSKFEKILEVKSFLELTELINTIRYDLNNFTNSYRATTFTLQSELRSKYKDEFNSWYDKAIIPLIKSEYSNLLKEIRNVNQKNGNNYFSFNISYTNDEAKVFYDINLANYIDDLIKPTNIELLKPLKIRISNGGPGSPLTEEDREIMNHELIKKMISIHESVNPENFSNFKLENIKLLDKRFEIPQFKEIINEQMLIMKQIIDDASDYFK